MMASDPSLAAGGVAASSPSSDVVALSEARPPWAVGARASGEFLSLISRDFARDHLVCSVGRARGEDGVEAERLAVSPTTLPLVLHNVSVRLRTRVAPFVVEPQHLAEFIDASYGLGSAAEGATRQAGEEHADAEAAMAKELQIGLAERDLLSVEGKGRVPLLVDALLFDALGRAASDVHVQPLADRTLVRFRVDGVLYTVNELPPALTNAVITRIKVMARMDVAERGSPQDGRSTVTIGSGDAARLIDLRISTLPTSYGERAVIRLLDNSSSKHLADFSSLGMPPRIAGPFLERATRAHGIILVTGPTGSGKTTTLYATLKLIAAQGGDGSTRAGGEYNVMTIEDPIEYELSTAGIAISQSQINPKKGVHFATGLRHILRQDPDVVMVGEIRDAETARIALQASLTGHLVLSTLHTNDAAGAVTRLIDLGVEPFLVGASLSCVLAQRLVRRLHGPCGGRGCEACFGKRYKGRIGVFELLLVDDRVRELLSRNAGALAIREAAISRGMCTLMEEGNRLVTEGITSAEEVRRVVQGLEDLPEDVGTVAAPHGEPAAGGPA